MFDHSDHLLAGYAHLWVSVYQINRSVNELVGEGVPGAQEGLCNYPFKDYIVL